MTSLYALATTDEAAVVVSVLAVRGSSPREAGAKMIVTGSDCIGSIGGGQLEYQCAAIAVDMLGQSGVAVSRKFVLGASLGQCCGGVVEVLFEPVNNGVPRWLDELCKADTQRQNVVLATSLSGNPTYKAVIQSPESPAVFQLSGKVLKTAQELLSDGGVAIVVDDVFLEIVAAPDLNIAVFGAGHVGSAVVATLAGLDARIRWIDSRNDVFSEVPRSVQVVCAESPALEVEAMPASGFYLVMTHSHKLDLEICAAILARNDASYCGLIGSVSKRRRFEKQLLQLGFEQAIIDTLVCPIGVDGVHGKKPAEIAIATAAEVLQFYDRKRDGNRDEHLASTRLVNQ
jgi:xanthine dehydrogenase accessory factor